MSSLIRSLARLNRGIDAFSEWTGRVVSWLTVLMVVVTFLIVVLRYAFNMGWIALQESVLYMHAIVFLVGMAYTLKRGGHVRVDIFYRQRSAVAKAVINLLGTWLFLFPTCGFIFWVSWAYVAESWSVLEGSREAGGLPAVFLLKTVILVMAALVMLQGLSETIRSLLVLTERRGSR